MIVSFIHFITFITRFLVYSALFIVPVGLLCSKIPVNYPTTKMKSEGLHKSFGVNATDEDKNIRKRDRLRKTGNLLVQEAKAVSLWSLLAMFLRIVLTLLGTMYTGGGGSLSIDGGISRWLESLGSLKELVTTACVLAGWILHLTPSKVPLFQAPGFNFANPWMLLWIRDKTGVIPNLPIRACEYVMGRISLLELVALVPTHIVTVVTTFVFVKRILPTYIVEMAFEPIEYLDGENPWVMDFSREVIASSAFTIMLLVLPAFFQLNYMPRWIFGYAMYPLLNFSVDGPGMASAFSPNVLLALSVLGNKPLPSFWRLLGPLLGGLVGGRVMKLYFPDDREKVGAS